MILEETPGLLTPGTPKLHYTTIGPEITANLVALGGGLYEAQLPAEPCGTIISYYISAETDNGMIWRNPSQAPATMHEVVVATNSSLNFRDDFETDTGWIVTNDLALLNGAWDRGVPIGGGDLGDPPTDADGSGLCYLTDNVDGNSDVDSGWTTLTSPILDPLGNGTPFVEYYRWFTTDAVAGDSLLVELSMDNGATWIELETVTNSSSQWNFRSFRLDRLLSPTDRMRMRFTASDTGGDSLVEAGVDGLQIVRDGLHGQRCHLD